VPVWKKLAAFGLKIAVNVFPAPAVGTANPPAPSAPAVNATQTRFPTAGVLDRVIVPVSVLPVDLDAPAKLVCTIGLVVSCPVMSKQLIA